MKDRLQRVHGFTNRGPRTGSSKNSCRKTDSGESGTSESPTPGSPQGVVDTTPGSRQACEPFDSGELEESSGKANPEEHRTLYSGEREVDYDEHEDPAGEFDSGEPTAKCTESPGGEAKAGPQRPLPERVREDIFPEVVDAIDSPRCDPLVLRRIGN